MSLISPYTLHKEVEQKHLDLRAGLRRKDHPDKMDILATSLLQTRNLQSADAKVALTGRTVHVYIGSTLLVKLRCCEVGISTARVCFTLFERTGSGAIEKNVEITPDMNIFVENALG